MQNTWSHLLLVFGLAAPLVSAALLQTAAMNFTSRTTLLTMMSANSTTTQALTDNSLLPSTLVDLPTSTTLAIMVSANSTTTQALTNSSLLPSTPVNHTMMSANSTTTQALTESSLLPSTAVDIPTSTTLDTIMSGNPTDTQSLSDVESTFNPLPVTSPTLSVNSNYEVPTPTPGSVAILNGIPTRVLNDTIQQQSIPLDADTANTESTIGTNLYQAWNTSYPGPIHDGDWVKYLQIWDPVWWSTNLDSLRQTSCLCSHEDFLTNPTAQLAAYMNFEFYSHNSGAVYSLDWICGPSQSTMSISERITSAKGKAEHCWQMAGGEYAGDHVKFPEIKSGYYCDEKEELCVEPWRDGKRSLTFHGHKRYYDRDGVHTWSEIQPVVRDVCAPICEDKFMMRFDDMSHHNPSFLTTFYPPKPIDLTMMGD